MLNRITITAYKCIEEEQLTLAPLTLLAGPNASGKSTVIQGFLLALSSCKGPNSSFLEPVIRPYKNHETILCRYSENETVFIGLDRAQEENFLSIKMHGNQFEYYQSPTGTGYHYEESFFYLSANRTGVEEIVTTNQTLRIGHNGQYAIGYLEQQKDKPIHEALQVSDAPAKTLKSQLAWWLTFITGIPTEARTEKVGDIQVRLSFKMGEIDDVSPQNTGAGNSYLLKMLVVCLTVKPGDLLLIENPEVHLHPGAQSRLGILLAFLAARGVQIVAETHCEHLINRIRYEIYAKKLSHDQVILHYKPDVHSSFQTLKINERGHYTDPDGNEQAFPKGFFDSTLSELLEIS
ncbi:conserved hypothetical protein [Gammaproteobacteria bacterium]